MTTRSPTELRKRGPQPGVSRGQYKPRAIKAIEPQTPEELATLDAGTREYWGDLYDRNAKVFARELGRTVFVRTYLPPAPEGDGTAKTCSRCGLDWPLDHFSPSRGGRLGVKAACKSCCAKYARERANNPEGKAARARADAKFRAHLAAEERRLKEKAAFIETASKTPAGRALLAALGMIQGTHQEGGKC
ncbi:hypothetical protein ACSFA7_22580 [Variovorax sp. LT1R20]|uniref:hypothetical protein n=1 Tax=Variovorax sp. LT1R20 TaxID=3443729 RepID=UPI003F450CCA